MNCINEYLEIRIEGWYALAKTEYSVDGMLTSIKWGEDLLYIETIENGKIVKCVIAYPQEYTAEQLYCIWMEKAE